jgi:hypothetical protein
MITRRTGVCALVLLLAVSEGCRADRNDAADQQSAAMDCVRHGYPCTWGEVAVAVLDSTELVADRAFALLDRGATVAEVAATIQQRPDAGIVLHDEYAVRFWLKGGRPVWLYSPEAARLGLSAASSLNMAMQAKGQTDAVGSSPPGQKPRKALLLLDPYRWEWSLGIAAGLSNQSEEEDVAIPRIFSDKRVRDYKCDPADHCPCDKLLNGACVEIASNNWQAGCDGSEPGCSVVRNVTLDHFKDWGRYDVIHVSSHGTELCDTQQPQNCAAAIASGPILSGTLREILEARADDRSVRGLPPDRRRESAWLSQVGVELTRTRASQYCSSLSAGQPAYDEGRCEMGLLTTAWREYLSLDFFKDAYKPGDLKDKLIFLNSCVSMKHKVLAGYLAGNQDNAVIGWGNYVENGKASRAAAMFYSTWLGGATAYEAFKKLLEVPEWVSNLAPAFAGQKDVVRGDDGDIPAAPVFGPPRVDGAEGKRGIEIVFLRDPDTEEEVQDGGMLSLAEGVPGDGLGDVLAGLIDIVGISTADDPQDFALSMRVGNETVRRTYRPNQTIGDSVLRYRGAIELGFDLPESPVDVEVWAELPGGGRSRWLYEDMRVPPPCWFKATVSGSPAAGLYEGRATLLGNVLGFVDAKGRWSATLEVPSGKVGSSPVGMQAVAAKIPVPGRRGDTATIIGYSGGTGAYAPAHATIRINRVTNDPLRPGTEEGSLEGQVNAHLAWEDVGGAMKYFDADISFVAVPYAVAPGSQYRRCRESWDRR